MNQSAIKAKIIESASGYWVARETRKGSRYTPCHDEVWHNVTLSLLDPIDYSGLIHRHLGVQTFPQTPSRVIEALLTELRHKSVGMLFAMDDLGKLYQVVSKT